MDTKTGTNLFIFSIKNKIGANEDRTIDPLPNNLHSATLKV